MEEALSADVGRWVIHTMSNPQWPNRHLCYTSGPKGTKLSSSTGHIKYNPSVWNFLQAGPLTVCRSGAPIWSWLFPVYSWSALSGGSGRLEVSLLVSVASISFNFFISICQKMQGQFLRIFLNMFIDNWNIKHSYVPFCLVLPSQRHKK